MILTVCVFLFSFFGRLTRRNGFFCTINGYLSSSLVCTHVPIDLKITEYSTGPTTVLMQDQLSSKAKHIKNICFLVKCIHFVISANGSRTEPFHAYSNRALIGL